MAKGLTITDSPNISFLDFAAKFDVPNLTLTFDLSPSIWISTGYSNVQGVKFTVISPSGVALSGSGGAFDIAPPTVLTGTAVYTLQESFQSVEWGIYTINCILTDANGTEYPMETAYFDMCRPAQSGNELNTSEASMNLKLTSQCRDGIGKADDATVYVYKVTAVSNKVYDNKIYLDATLELPNPFVTTTNPPPITFDLYTGKTTFKSSVIATYNFDDSYSVIINYVGSISKEVLCEINFCNVYCGVAALADDAVRKAGTPDELIIKQQIYDIMFNLEMVQLAIDCNYDQSKWVENIDTIGGIDCSCDCNGRVNPAPVSINDTFNIIGTGSVSVTSSTAGNTTTFTVNGKTYSIVYGGVQATPEITIATNTSGNVTTISLSLNLASLVTYFSSNMNIGGILSSATDSAPIYIPNNTTETTIYSYTLPATTGANAPVNTLSKDGDELIWRVYFQNLNVATASPTVRFKLAGTTALTLSFPSSPDFVTMEIRIVRNGANSQTVYFNWVRGAIISANSNYQFVFDATMALGSTNVLSVTGQNTNAVSQSMVFVGNIIELVKKVA